VDDKEQDDIKFYRQLVKDAATENERLQNACKSYVAQANKDALELDRLRRELAETEQKRIDEWLVSEVLRRELAEAQRDAARYRWLRERAYKDDGSIYCAGPDGSYDDFAVGYLPDGLDAAIDAAMAEPKEVPRG
jgi:5-methylcytosine-specific restriction endonuclease McrBC GTP-binding regulatory subunit McrB